MKKVAINTLIVLLFWVQGGCNMAHDNEKHDETTAHGSNKKGDDHAGNNHGHKDAFGDISNLLEEEQARGSIIFTLDQQRQVDFSTAETQMLTLRPSLTVTGSLKAAGGGEAIVVAPVSGYLSPQKDFPRLGEHVRGGEILFRIVPQISSEADPATLELAVRRSQSNHELALQELKRLEKLLSQDAIPERRVSAALKEEEVARAELEAAKRRLKQYRSNPKEKFEATAVLVTSPIDGVLDGIYLNPGAYLQEGTPLFHVVDTTRLRLEARIVEADIGRLVQPHGAWFEVDGFETAFEINLANGGRLITLGRVVDPQTRTVPLVFEFSNPKDQLRIGMFARIHVLTGKPKKALAIPLTAVQENAGQTSTYIQTGDQNFEHRVLRLGLRDGQFIEVISGLTKGDRVVTQGSYLIQLAASGTQEIGHGHAH